MAILDDHCANVGRDPSAIQRSAVALLFMSDDAAFIDKMKSRNLGQAAIIGSPAEVKEIVQAYEAIGVDELIVPDFTLGAREQKLATLDTFISEVAGR
jgi:alkanesulfonate monooxygenase SsuD/methylene tetrahydromethanopterin reductase-like flavin-dependent oxidoreductase (luciferase family)